MIQNTILQFIIKTLSPQLSDPNSDYYLPKLIKNQSPPYDPYCIEKWDLNVKFTKAKIGVQESICIRTENIGHHVGDPEIVLSNVVVSGLSNVLLKNTPNVTNDNIISADVVFSTVVNNNDYNKSITLNGDFSLVQSCKYNNEQYIASGTGTFTYTISSSEASAKISVSANNDQLIATVQSLVFNA